MKFLGGKEFGNGRFKDSQLFFEFFSEVDGHEHTFGIMCDGMPITCFGQSEYDYSHKETRYLVEVTQTVGETNYIEYEQYFDSLRQAEPLVELLKGNKSVTVRLISIDEYSIDGIPYKGTEIMKVYEQTEIL
jgi:hypothetical protein